jgi:hypothetical protein
MTGMRWDAAHGITSCARVEVADAPRADQPLLHELLHGGDRVGERVGSAPVQQVEVEPVGAEALEAAARGLARAAAGRVRRQHLADEEDLVAAAGDRLADELLGSPAAVHLGGVDRGEARVEAGAQGVELGRAGGGLVAHVPGALREGDRAASVGEGGRGDLGVSHRVHPRPSGRSPRQRPRGVAATPGNVGTQQRTAAR